MGGPRPSAEGLNRTKSLTPFLPHPVSFLAESFDLDLKYQLFLGLEHVALGTGTMSSTFQGLQLEDLGTCLPP